MGSSGAAGGGNANPEAALNKGTANHGVVDGGIGVSRNGVRAEGGESIQELCTSDA